MLFLQYLVTGVIILNRTISYIIPPEFDGKRVIAFLRGNAGLSYRLVRSLKQQPGAILFDGEHIRTVDTLKAGGTLTITLPCDEAEIEPQPIHFDIVFEDSDLLIIDKPAGLAMHPTHNHQGDTLANGVAYYLQQKNSSAVFRTAGRLDKNTSGLVVCSLNRLAASKLAGKGEKKYLAIVQGEYSDSGTIDAPIIRPDPMKTLRAVGEGGERAVTHWECLGCKNGLSLMSITLETGRTHQIRVHFSSLGTPLAGDDMYGGSRELIGRHALHCAELSLTHPVSGERLSFSSPLPGDMKALANLITDNEV